jgi:hypothetical protein
MMTRSLSLSLSLLLAGTGLAGADQTPNPGENTMDPTQNQGQGQTQTPSQSQANEKQMNQSDPYGGSRYGVQKTEVHKTAGEEAMPAEQTSTGPSKMGLSVMAGGGVVGFSNSNATDVTNTGGSWEARLGYNYKYIGTEIAYVGTAQNINALGLDSNAWLASNGVEGLLRLNIGTYFIQPFVFGGPSYVHYSIQNSNFNTSDVRSSDDTFALPFGGGFSARLGSSGAIFDARFTYRPVWGKNFFANSSDSTNTDLSNWLVTGRLGWVF